MKKQLPAKPGADGTHESNDMLEGSRGQPPRRPRAIKRDQHTPADGTALSHSDIARYCFGLLFALAALGAMFFSDNRYAQNWAYATLGSLVTAFVTRRTP